MSALWGTKLRLIGGIDSSGGLGISGAVFCLTLFPHCGQKFASSDSLYPQLLQKGIRTP